MGRVIRGSRKGKSLIFTAKTRLRTRIPFGPAANRNCRGGISMAPA